MLAEFVLRFCCDTWSIVAPGSRRVLGLGGGAATSTASGRLRCTVSLTEHSATAL